jgi:hypothetical protein
MDRNPVLIDLALQGGGSHGAFTWGVLDRLLEEPWLRIAGNLERWCCLRFALILFIKRATTDCLQVRSSIDRLKNYGMGKE